MGVRYNKNNTRNYSRENNPSWKGGKPKCLDCGKQLKKYTAKRCKSCSRKGVFYGNRKFGKDNPNWKGGTKNSLAERVKFHETIRNEVLRRDGYCCVLCGSNENLQVDHVQPWAEYPELRFNIDNCRTLCMNCHYRLTFGKDMVKPIFWGGTANLMKGAQ